MLQSLDITDCVADDYVTYALSTLNRALPSAIDGLKVSQRRVIQAGFGLGLLSSKPYRKIARWAGETSGLLHPHGDCSPTIVNLGIPANYRYPLVELHGNIGGSTLSGVRISNDAPAASRYLEGRLSAFAEAVFDIPPQYLPNRPSYDGQVQEVIQYVPALPLALLNACTGIGTGYATSSTSYNLAQVVKAIKSQDLGLPDLPQGCTIVSTNLVGGRGTFVLQGSWSTGTTKFRRSTRNTITITELATGSAETLCDLLRDKVASSGLLANVEDFSSGEGIRVVITLAKGVSPDEVLPLVLRQTNLQSTIQVNNTMLIDSKPVQLSPLTILKHWYEARLAILHKMHSSLLDQANHQVHLHQGYEIAKLNLDQVVKSEGKALGLGLSPVQVKAIMEKPLKYFSKPTGLELWVAEVSNHQAILADLPKHIDTQTKALSRKFNKARVTRSTASHS